MRKRARLLWLLLLVPIAIGWSRLRFDVDVLNLLPSGTPEVQGLRLFQEWFTDASELIVTVKARDAELAEQAARTIAETLRNYESLVRRVSPHALSERPEVAELTAFAWLNQPPGVLAEQAQAITGAELTNQLITAREILASSFSPQEIAATAYDPLGFMSVLEQAAPGALAEEPGADMFSSPDGTFRVIHAESARPIQNYQEAQTFMEGVETIVEISLPAELRETVSIGYTGGPAFVSEIAGGMERDMTLSVGGTALIVSMLFGIAHRRWIPLLWLLFLLACILAGTLALGGFVFGALNIVSLGFAAILLGLTADYALVLYQEARASGKPASVVRKEIRPGILWSSLTTAGAFWLLNFSSLPGLAQLGTLVGIGVLLAAAVMMAFYLRPLVRDGPSSNERVLPEPAAGERRQASSSANPAEGGPRVWRRGSSPAWFITALVLVLAAVLLWRNPPGFDASPEALRPRGSSAYAAMEQLGLELGREEEPLWLIVRGASEQEVADRLEQTRDALGAATAEGVLDEFTLPLALWPNPAHQAANRATIQEILRREEYILGTLSGFGFVTESSLTAQVLGHWRRALEQPGVFRPRSHASQAVLNRVAVHREGEFAALGMARPSERNAGQKSRASEERQLVQELRGLGVATSNWDWLSAALLDTVKRELRQIMLPVGVLVLGCLWLAFRRIRDVVLCIAMLGFSGVALTAVMAASDWSWNLMNLMAVPLLLGAGVDYSIHMILAMRRHQGDRVAVGRSVGRALLLCGASTAAAFGSLAFSHNQGMASLGQVCSAGIICMMLTAVFLLPNWWRTVR
jgi:uncharacterized protein